AFVWLSLEAQGAAASLSMGEIQSICQRGRVLDEEFNAFQRFIAARKPVLQSLCREEISLRQACELVRDLAEESYPQFLHYLATSRGKGLKEKMAQWLLIQLGPRASQGAASGQCLQRLQAELRSRSFQAWCSEMPAWQTPPRLDL